MPWGLALVAGGILGSAGLNALGASSSANTQSRAAQNALNLQRQEFQQTQSNLSPFLTSGQNALSFLQPGGGTYNFLTQNPYNIVGPNPQVANIANQPQWNYQPLTQSQFQSSPGYNFQLQQALDAVQNSNARRTGAFGGNTLQALQGYGTGLAQQDWWNAYNAYQQNYLNQYNAQNQAYTQTQGYLGNAFNQLLGGTAGQQSNIYNILAGLAGSGQNAAVQQGGFGQAAVNNMSNLLGQQGNVQAAGQVGITNALAGPQGGINNILSLLLSNPSAYGAGGGNTNLNYLLNNAFGGGGNTSNAFASELNNAPYTTGFGGSA